MSKTIRFLALAALGLAVRDASATGPLAAELIMPGGRSWKGQVVGRDGDWIEFSTGAGARPIRVGASTIQELVFAVDLDTQALNEMNRNREFERVIAALERTLEPYAEFSDIPSNLTFYNGLLMELYHRVGNFDKSLELSAKIVEDDRNPDLQEKARVLRALSLVDAGRLADAESLLAQYGWDKDLGEDSAPAKLFIAARLLALKQQYNRAMELVAYVVAFSSQDPEWMQPAELLCAEIYTELGMYDSAEEVIRQISMLYKETPENDKAQRLKIRIERLRAERQLEGGSQAGEA